MSEHMWVHENLASYVADGLDSAERDRLERHIAECPECTSARDDAQALDRKLGQLFVDARPGPSLEDDLVQQLRQQRQRNLRFSRGVKVVWAAAAVALLAIIGAGMSDFLDPEKNGDSLFAEMAGHKLGVDIVGGTVYHLEGFPATRAKITNNLKQMGVAAHGYNEQYKNLTPNDDAESLATELRTQTEYGWSEQNRGDHHKLQELQGVKLLDSSHSMRGRKETETTRTGAKAEKNDPLTATDHDEAFLGKDGGGEGKQKEQEKEVRDLTQLQQKRQRLFYEVEDKRGPGNDGEHYYLPLQTFNDTVNGRLDGDALKVGKERQQSTTPMAGEKQEQDRQPREEAKPSDGYGVQLAQQGKQPAKMDPPEPVPADRKIIRSGQIDFEVDSFDNAVAVLQRLVAATKGGFIATINSDKLANGKVKGSVVVRVPPEQLDNLVLSLRKELAKSGELKGQHIGSQDITKQYTDLESRLRAARTMEERLLKIIRDGKGEIKDLVQAEKELGVWRTRIEETEGELRYYANQVSLSMLTINLTEKEIRVAAAVTEHECVQTGIEVEDVDKALRAALQAVSEAKGRVTRSELKQHAAGQFSALLHFEVAPEQAGAMRDRLKQLGTQARLQIDRTQQAEGGGKLPNDGKLQRGNTRFEVALYNLANVEPREKVDLRIAAVDVAQTYRALREALGKAEAHVRNAQLNEQDRLNVTAHVDFDLRRGQEALVQTALTDAGETLSRQVQRKPAGENLTDAKVLYTVTLVSAAYDIPPRENIHMAVEVPKVEAALAVLNAQVKEAQGRTLDSKIALERNGRVTARVIYDVPLSAAASLVEKVRDAGHVRVHQVDLDQKAPTGKLAIARLDVTLSNAELLLPGEAGLWTQLRHGLSISLRGLAYSAGWLVVGVLFVLPWILLIAAIIWLTRRLWRGTPATPQG
jgi:hypothetical protein